MDCPACGHNVIGWDPVDSLDKHDLRCCDCGLSVSSRAWKELEQLRAENDRLRGLIKTYRNMLRYDWIAAQDRQIKELSAEIAALRGEEE